jgi:hypothetical protein
VERPFSEIPDAISELPDGALKDQFGVLLRASGGETRPLSGAVAPAFVGQPGGAIQLQSIFTANDLQVLGIITEVLP